LNTTESDPEARRSPGIPATSSSSPAPPAPAAGTPFIAPYFAAKAALDSLATDYADELLRFGIDTGIVVPGAFASGTRHFDHSGYPADTQRAAEYDKYGTFMRRQRALAWPLAVAMIRSGNLCA
jgi:NAD(P)-dependent dehydrogenase (short-subunit alcohol dehydrogenase family)